VEEDYFKQLETSLRKEYYGWEGAKQFEGTGERLTREYHEFCWSNTAIKDAVDACFTAAYVDRYDEMLTAGPIEAWTLCPHHLLPCRFTVYIGYIPNELVLGLSKFARLAAAFSHRPVIQEMYTRELADAIEEGLHPKGIGVFVSGEHGCMRARGVKQEAAVTTSVLRGVMMHKLEARTEFYQIVRGGFNGK
jgi:GTP cyclohydrolase I